MTRAGGLKPGGLPDRIAEFFAANPDEELTYDDARVKFGLTDKRMHEAMNRLRGLGIVETVHLIRAKRG